ncbi:MAG: hypothetical protein WCI05_00925 [Myxococcales bacterium]|jgi:hypothetical protein
MTKVHRLRVILGLDREDFPGLLAGSKAIHSKMSENAALFPAPNPSMAVLGAQIAELNQSHQAVTIAKVKGMTGARGVKRDVVWSSLEMERAYVQSLVDASPELAASYAEAAGMKIAAAPSHDKPILQGKVTAKPGTVALIANASMLVGPGGGTAKHRTYLWRWTADGGKTVVNAEASPIARTEIDDLPLNTNIGFEVAVKDSEGTGEWSQMITLFVH